MSLFLHFISLSGYIVYCALMQGFSESLMSLMGLVDKRQKVSAAVCRASSLYSVISHVHWFQWYGMETADMTLYYYNCCCGIMEFGILFCCRN